MSQRKVGAKNVVSQLDRELVFEALGVRYPSLDVVVHGVDYLLVLGGAGASLFMRIVQRRLLSQRSEKSLALSTESLEYARCFVQRCVEIFEPDWFEVKNSVVASSPRSLVGRWSLARWSEQDVSGERIVQMR